MLCLKGVEDITAYCDKSARDSLGRKMGHSEATQSKNYGYLAHNHHAVEAIENLKLSATKKNATKRRQNPKRKRT